MGAPGTTPGKWRVGHTGFLGTGVLPSSAEMRTEGGPIITCWDGCIGPDEALANARQTVASGAMYDALEELRAAGVAFEIAMISTPRSGDEYRDACLRFTQARNRADAALAQARGEVSVHTLEGGL